MGVLAAIAVGVGGAIVEWRRWGTSDRVALTRLQTAVRERVGRDLRLVETAARQVATDPEVRAAVGASEIPIAVLFARLERVLASFGPAEVAATIYRPTGQPVAWYGRPGELSPARLARGPTVFAATDPRNVRVVAVTPISAARRIGPRDAWPPGVVAVERVVAATGPTGRAGEFILNAELVPVSLSLDSPQRTEDPNVVRFDIAAPDGSPLLRARVALSDIARARRAWRDRVVTAMLLALTGTLLALIGPALDRRARARSARLYVRESVLLVALLLAARAVAVAAVDRPWRGPTQGLSFAHLDVLVGSPVDLLLTGLAFVGLVAVAADAVGRWGLTWARRRYRLATGLSWGAWLAAQIATGLLAGLAARASQGWLAAIVSRGPYDPTHFSLHPWSGTRLAWLGGLVALQIASLWSLVLLFLAAAAPWREPRGTRLLAGGARTIAAGVVLVIGRGELGASSVASALVGVSAAALAPLFARRVTRRYRRGSSAARLVAVFGAVLTPALLFYPAVAELAERTKRHLVETRYAPQAIRHREELQASLATALETIDGLPDLPALVASHAAYRDEVDADLAFAVWRQTPLAKARLTSSLELYDPQGVLRSRFALNFPEYTPSARRWRGGSCRWEVFAEVIAPGAQARQALHAERALCIDSPGSGSARIVGGVVVHAMLDYRTLPFLSSQSPYVELFRAENAALREDMPGRDIELVIYGWGLRPLFTSTGDAWSLDETTVERVRGSRQPFWTVLARNGLSYRVYFANDRAGIYAVGYPMPGLATRLVHLGELVTFVGLAFLAGAAGLAAFTRIARAPGTRGRVLWREIRTSFYRRVFLAFVFAAAVPTLVLAVAIRAYVAGQLRAGVEAEATRTALVAQKVIEEALALQQRAGQAGLGIADDVLVWIGQIIDQGVNIFEGPRLVATSERDLFASGLLPTRTPAEVYRAIALERRPSFVSEDRIGAVRYLLAAAPIRAIDRPAILTVPLLPRQQEIEQQIDQLDRGVRLGALVFLLLGAALGYSMAQRISDPVSRLTRATRRIARGDFDAPLASRTADELGSLVDAFNRMAAELKAQREQLERTHRLEAWAEMARQVAHEIKNPLTPIQLSAEHLLRVHADRGDPLSPALERCVAAILSQVRLLRQIAAEFSSFASQPTAKPAPTDVAALVAEVLEPYRSGLGDRIRLDVRLPTDLPRAYIDRVLMARALTNVIENALHAMPGGGRLIVDGEFTDGRIRLRVTDTGVGMDEDARARAFEPYFSTKASGTGLGLTIAKRNVELNGGTIDVESEKGRGTTVTLTVPATAPPADG